MDNLSRQECVIDRPSEPVDLDNMRTSNYLDSHINQCDETSSGSESSDIGEKISQDSQKEAHQSSSTSQITRNFDFQMPESTPSTSFSRDNPLESLPSTSYTRAEGSNGAGRSSPEQIDLTWDTSDESNDETNNTKQKEKIDRRKLIKRRNRPAAVDTHSIVIKRPRRERATTVPETSGRSNIHPTADDGMRRFEQVWRLPLLLIPGETSPYNQIFQSAERVPTSPHYGLWLQQQQSVELRRLHAANSTPNASTVLQQTPPNFHSLYHHLRSIMQHLRQFENAEAAQPPEPKGVPQRVIIEKTISYPYKATDSTQDMKSCVICLHNFVEQENIRRLPCCHCFHKPCIDLWLQANNQCPVCRYALI